MSDPQPSMQKSPPSMSVGNWRSYVELLSQNRSFRRLWLAGVISQLGNWFNYIAIFVLLTQLTGSGQAVSWFLIAKFIPTTVFGPAAGVIADRFPRKFIMIASDLSRAAIVLCFLLVRSPDMVWLVYFLALIQESIWSFFDPARQASVPNLCKMEELRLANALAAATWSILLAFGAALGGFVTALFGWQTALILDAMTFLVSALLIKSISLPQPSLTERKNRKIPNRHLSWRDYTGFNDLRDGSRYVLNHHRVAKLLLVKSGWALSGGILVMLTVFGEQIFAVDGKGGGSGILYSVRGLGAAAGPVLAWRFLGETQRDMYRGIALSFFISAVSYLFFSRAVDFASAIPFVFLGHVGGSIQWVFSTTLLQQTVPDTYRGRVFAAEMALVTLILSISTYCTGLALDQGIDPRTVVVGLASMFFIPGIFWLLYYQKQKHLFIE